MICRVCGEQKESKDFYKVKHFYKYHHCRIIWCRDCQKMYVQMKKQQEIQKELEKSRGTFCVQFE